MRYELKMTFDDHQIKQIEKILFTSSLAFREIYHERKVNNIYFDTLDYHDYNANIDGLYDRSKFRIRWYGEESHFYPILEEKIKKGELGTKKIIDFNDLLTQDDILKNYQTIRLSDINQSFRFNHRHPTLLNSYLRRYYMSANTKIRVTIDKNINYAHPVHINRTIQLHDLAIIELKFEQEDYPLVQSLIQNLNLRFDKNSKYVSGIQHIKNL